MTVVRPMTKADIPAAKKVICSVNKGQLFDLEILLNKCLNERPHLSLVAENSSGLVGIILGSTVGVLGMIDTLAVQRDFQKMGVGQALVEDLMDHVSKLGARKLIVLSWDGSVDFYKKMGFAVDPDICFMSRDANSNIRGCQ